MKLLYPKMVPALLTITLLLSSCRAEGEEVRFKEDSWIAGEPVPNMVDYKPSVDCPDCPTEFRIGDCWQCFEAKGKMCIDKEGKGLFNHMTTTKPGVGFCCNPNSNSEYCTTGTQHGHEADKIEILCGPNSYVTSEQAETTLYKDIVTGDRNHQMFAYCPYMRKNICGLPEGTMSSNMILYAQPDNVKTIETNQLLYVKQGFDVIKEIGIGSEDASYDACHYMVAMDTSISTLSKYDPEKPVELNLKITKKSADLNVYIWEGTSRDEAKKSVVEGNLKVDVGQSFTVPAANNGYLIVAYPENNLNSDIAKEFAFEYWVNATLLTESQQEQEEQKQEEQQQQQEQQDQIIPDKSNIVDIEASQSGSGSSRNITKKGLKDDEEGSPTMIIVIIAVLVVAFVVCAGVCCYFQKNQDQPEPETEEDGKKKEETLRDNGKKSEFDHPASPEPRETEYKSPKNNRAEKYKLDQNNGVGPDEQAPVTSSRKRSSKKNAQQKIISPSNRPSRTSGAKMMHPEASEEVEFMPFDKIREQQKNGRGLKVDEEMGAESQE